MLNEGKNEGESLALLIWALEMSLMALQYTLPPLTECKSREGEEGKNSSYGAGGKEAYGRFEFG